MNTTISPLSLRRSAAGALLVIGGALALAGCDRRTPTTDPATGGTGSSPSSTSGSTGSTGTSGTGGTGMGSGGTGTGTGMGSGSTGMGSGSTGTTPMPPASAASQ